MAQRTFPVGAVVCWKTARGMARGTVLATFPNGISVATNLKTAPVKRVLWSANPRLQENAP